MIVPVRGMTTGLVSDVKDYLLPPNALNILQNARVKSGSVVRGMALTEAQTYALTSNPVRGFFSVRTATENYLVFCTPSEILVGYGTTLDDITQVGGYAGTAMDRWSGCLLGDVLVVTNNIDPPQMWSSPPNPATPMADLTAWPASTLCKTIKSFKNFLVVSNVTKGSTVYPRLIKWSHPAAAGSVPSTWDESDATKDAGEVNLGEGDSPLVDALVLQDYLVHYTERETWVQRFIGGRQIMGFSRIFPDQGILAQGCAAQFSNQHFVVTTSDLVVHNASTWQSVATDRVRDRFFGLLNPTYYYLTQVAVDFNKSEIWVCFPISGQVLERALVWNWQYDTWYERTLVDIDCVNTGIYPVAAAANPWTITGETWDDTGVDWNPSSSPGTRERLLTVDSAGLVAYSNPNEFSDAYGSPWITYIGRTGLAIKGLSQNGQPVVDYDTIAQYQEFRPNISAPSGASIEFSFGVRDNESDSVNFTVNYTYVVGTTEFIPLYLVGRYLDFRIIYQEDSGFLFEGFDLDVVPLSRR